MSDEPKAVSSAVWSALKCVDGFDDDDDEKAKATSEDIETGSRLSKASESPIIKARKATNVDSFRRNFEDERPSAGAPVSAHRGHDDGDEQPSAGARMVADTAPLALQTSVPAHHGDDDGDEQPSVGAIPVETRSRELKKDEQTSVAHTDGRFLSPGAIPMPGLRLITESDERFELNTTSPPSQRAPAQHEDPGRFLAEAFLVPEDPPMITAVEVVPSPPPPVVLSDLLPTVVLPDPPPDPPPTVELSDPPPMRKWWHWSKFQCGGLILCLILVVGVSVGVAVGVSGGSDDGGPSPAPSTASFLSFEEVLAQSLPTNSQDAILVDDTPEAQAFTWLQDDPDVSTFTNVEVLQRFALATMYYATDGANWVNNDGWLDYDVVECDWFTSFDLIEDFNFSFSDDDDFFSFDDLFSVDNLFSLGACSNDGRYSNLALSQNGLSGELPDALAVFTDLQTMILLDNFLTGQLPSDLGSLSLLTYLDFSTNRLNGTVPSEYGLLGNLDSMFLENNALRGTIPSTLGSLTQLSTLWLFGNRLTGSVPLELCQLVQTNGLDLQIDCDRVACDCGCVCA
jgi:hypothetical protein